jgi:hypothetical protein
MLRSLPTPKTVLGQVGSAAVGVQHPRRSIEPGRLQQRWVGAQQSMPQQVLPAAQAAPLHAGATQVGFPVTGEFRHKGWSAGH